MALTFASGTNEIGYIRGFADAGIPVGVSLNDITEDGIVTLLAVAAAGTPCFVDSGAFSEVKFGPAGREVVAPITAAEWDRRLSVYERLAPVMGNKLTLVAPDAVGDQDETLARLTTYRERVRRLYLTGARVLVAVQKGAMSQVEFWAAATAVLGVTCIPAMPMKKSACTPEEALDFAMAVQPREIHLLGMGATNRHADELLEALAEFAPNTTVSMDSNLITSNVGRASGLRPLTIAQDLVREEMDLYMGVQDRELGTYIDYTEDNDPAEFSTPAERRAIADRCSMTAAQKREFVNRPEEFLQSWVNGEDSCKWYEDPYMQVELDRLWFTRADRTAAQIRKRTSVPVAFVGHPAVDSHLPQVAEAVA